MRQTEDEAVVDADEQARYELRVDGGLVAICDYRPVRGRLVLPHVEVNPAFGGRGLGTRLVRAVLDDVRLRGGLVEPVCPFVVAFVEANPDYADLVFTAEPDPLLEGQQRH